jgi:hypothetical protein
MRFALDRNPARSHHARDRRWARGVRLASGVIATGAVAMVCAGTASASCTGVYDEALPITASSPADGASIQASAVTPVSFSLRTPLHLLPIYVEVATQNVPGRDGTLANDYQKDFVQMTESDADPDLYTANTFALPGWWPSVPGTYYWQVQTFANGTANGVPYCHEYKSPVYTVTVTAPPPPAVTTPPAPPAATPSPPSVPTPPRLTFNDARSYAASMIRQRTHLKVQGGTITCSAVNNWTRHCNLAWTSGGYSYHASGRFWNYIGSDGQAYSWHDFTGTRTSLTCAPRSHGCTLRFHWH